MADGFVILVIGATLGGLVQGLSGSNFGMTSTAVWAWFLAPQVVAPLALTGSLTGQILGALTLRRGWHWRRIAPFLLGGLLGIPLGVALLPRLDTDLFKLVLGSLLVLTCPALLLASELPRVRVGGRIADSLAGLGGGILGGLGGYTGVIPTLWTTLRGLPKDEQRAIIQNFNLATLAVTMATYVGTGIVTRDMLPMFLVVGPAMLVPSILGARLYIGISEIAFRRIVLSLLTASGVALLSASLPKLLGTLH